MVDYIYDIVMAPDGSAYAARHSGLYRHDGAEWVYAYNNLDVEADGPMVTTAVAIAHDGTIFAGGPGGILRSEDNGASWHITPLPPPASTITRLVFSPNYIEDGAAFAGSTEDGMFNTQDRGMSWARWNFGLLDLSILSIAIASPDTLYAGTETGLYRSTNGGRAWRDMGFPEDLCPVLSLAVCNNGDLLIGTEGGAIYRNGTPPIPVGTLDAPVNALEVLPDGRIVALLANSVLISTDDAASWERLDLQTDADFIALAASDQMILVADTNGQLLTQ